MKKTSFKFFYINPAFIAFAILALFFASCKKIDTVSKNSLPDNWRERFFKLPDNAPDVLQRIADKIKEEDNRTGFLENFVRENGFIRWEYADIQPAKKKKKQCGT